MPTYFEFPAAQRIACGTRNSIACLPADVVLEILALLTGPELVNLACTSKTFYYYLNENSLWRGHCARYGLHDLTYFPEMSFRTAYTNLLYPYGSLIGLWANDHPYRGNILQFRLLTGNAKEPGGIVGSIWRLPGSLPISPQCIRVLKIQFAIHAHSSWNGAVEDVIITCEHHTSDIPPQTIHPVSLQVVRGSNRAIFHQAYRRTIPHPDFPGTSAVWYDHCRRLPRLRPTSPDEEVTNQHPLASLYPAVRLPILFTAPSHEQYVPLSGLSVYCRHNACSMLHRPPIQYESILPFSPLYYPVRPPPAHGCDGSASISSGIWFTQTLDPLCLYIGWQQSGGTLGSGCDADIRLRSWVLLGNSSTARGEILWDVKRVSVGESFEFEGHYLRITNVMGKLIKTSVAVSVRLESSDVIVIDFPDMRPMRCLKYDGAFSRSTDDGVGHDTLRQPE
ncbi:unnamed protein product [Somion occarium]|uniref:F-box domain-containing protein n=1 Tax=Somion occarium TaxID=3059160 RepID=A0ABP1DF44_9APHY